MLSFLLFVFLSIVVSCFLIPVFYFRLFLEHFDDDSFSNVSDDSWLSDGEVARRVRSHEIGVHIATLAQSDIALSSFWSALSLSDKVHLCSEFRDARREMFSRFADLAALRVRFDVDLVYSRVPDHHVLSSVFKVFRPLHVVARLEPWTVPQDFLKSFSIIPFDLLELHVNFYERVVPASIRAHTIRLSQCSGTTSDVLSSVLDSIRSVTRLEISGGWIDASCIVQFQRFMIDDLLFDTVILPGTAVSHFDVWLKHQSYLRRLIIRSFKNWDVASNSALLRVILKRAPRLDDLHHLELTVGDVSTDFHALSRFISLESLQLNIALDIHHDLFRSLMLVLRRLSLHRISIGFFPPPDCSFFVLNREVHFKNALRTVNPNIEFVDLL